jgi:hypothetical protein
VSLLAEGQIRKAFLRQMPSDDNNEDARLVVQKSVDYADYVHQAFKASSRRLLTTAPLFSRANVSSIQFFFNNPS